MTLKGINYNRVGVDEACIFPTAVFDFQDNFRPCKIIDIPGVERIGSDGISKIKVKTVMVVSEERQVSEQELNKARKQIAEHFQDSPGGSNE